MLGGRCSRVASVWLPVLASVGLVGGCANDLHQQQLAAARALPPEHFANSVTIKDDALETKAMFSTDKGFAEKRGVLGIVSEDQFLRAFIDKRTGARTYQVYVVLGYKSDIWREPFQANLGTPLTSAIVTRLRRESDCRQKKTSGCIRVEHVAFELPEAEFRRVIETATPTDMRTKMWVFRLKTRDGKDYNGEIPLAEFHGLKAAMDAHKVVASQ